MFGRKIDGERFFTIVLLMAKSQFLTLNVQKWRYYRSRFIFIFLAIYDHFISPQKIFYLYEKMISSLSISEFPAKAVFHNILLHFIDFLETRKFDRTNNLIGCFAVKKLLPFLSPISTYHERKPSTETISKGSACGFFEFLSQPPKTPSQPTILETFAVNEGTVSQNTQQIESSKKPKPRKSPRGAIPDSNRASSYTSHPTFVPPDSLETVPPLTSLNGSKDLKYDIESCLHRIDILEGLLLRWHALGIERSDRVIGEMFSSANTIKSERPHREGELVLIKYTSLPYELRFVIKTFPFLCR
jgi:hypothetical protein